MVAEAVYTSKFERAVRKIKDEAIKHRVKNQVAEILDRPDMGKPLRFDRKGERSVWVPPFRIIYSAEGNTVTFLNFGKRDIAYKR
ncbi:TPA: type II toxin-antitoxin system RelE/ParE family toxin [Candidatus Micrarchaeota archaeon]|nr:type II toxin-antitoxin system RelE/ParE family toxin [Candidatus Micrarchaeota archaeon]HIH30630.1 type II toxin-antitoxin system RelE/ParE family toxin [Candidatus Micrarchaeota archaeon]